jgi:hypothetical protein
MTNKKGVCFLVLLVFLVLFIVNSAIVIGAGLDSIDESAKNFQTNVENTENKVNDLTDTNVWSEKWGYLGKEWKVMLLKNSVVDAVDSFFNKFSFVFKFILGVDYSFTPAFLVVILLWLFFFFEWGKIFRSFEGANILSSYLVSAVFIIVFANFGFFKWLVLFLGNLIFSSQSSFVGVALFCVVIFGFFVIDYIRRVIVIIIRKEKKKGAKEEEKFEKWTFKKLLEVYTKRI